MEHALYQSGFHQSNKTNGTHTQLYCAIIPQQKRNTYNSQFNTKSLTMDIYRYTVCEYVHMCVCINIYSMNICIYV